MADECLDLDALLPASFKVKLKGKVYEIYTADGIPVEAVMLAGKMAADGTTGDPGMLRQLVALATGIPADVMADIRAKQLSALAAKIFPKVEEKPADPQPQA
jgi:hypothetical protein